MFFGIFSRMGGTSRPGRQDFFAKFAVSATICCISRKPAAVLSLSGTFVAKFQLTLFNIIEFCCIE